MIRKFILGTVATVVVAGVIFGRDAGSYARTACENVRNAVKSEITPEFELSRIRTEVDQLIPDIRKHKREVAELTVTVRDMERDVSRKQASLDSQRITILAMRAGLKSEEGVYRTASHTRATAEATLARKFSAYKHLEESIGRDKQLLTAQRQTLLANQQKLETVMSRKDELGIVVSQLEARLKTIQASEAVNSIVVDETRLTQVEDMIDRLNHELDVRESLLEMEGHSDGAIEFNIELDAMGLEDITSEIDGHFGMESQDDDSSLTDAI
ncbi:MAG: hypothetical protein ABJZ55_10550 [Fuerstiella sp.]